MLFERVKENKKEKSGGVVLGPIIHDKHVSIRYFPQNKSFTL